MTNNSHSTNVLAINRTRRTLNDNLKTRKAVGFSIHQLIKIRNNAQTEFEKREYTNVINTIYDYVYRPLTESISNNMETIKSSKRRAKECQRNYDKYNWLRKGTEIQFNHNGELKYGYICSPININEYNENNYKYGRCWICVMIMSPKKNLFGKTKLVAEKVTSITLDDIYGYYKGNNYIILK